MKQIRKINKLSIIIPVYYNEENLYPLYDSLNEVVFQHITYDYEVLLINDGSKDKSWEIIEDLSVKDPHIRGINLSRNFGSHAAILCGLSNSSGDCAVVKAADLQEPTELILQMVNEWEYGNNVVLATRDGRDENLSTTLFANLYYSIVKKFALPSMPKSGFDVYLVDKKVIDVLDKLDERNSALTCQILWSGFKTKEIGYLRQARTAGKSRWTLHKKIRLVMDTLFSFSSVPITIVSTVGIISFIGALIWAVIEVVLKLMNIINVEGWTTLFIFNLGSFGITMLTLGILGEYLWRTFDASRNRPPYIIEDKTNNKNLTEEKTEAFNNVSDL
ncbi:MAG: glycosyltransferase family 2 protein [Lachnospiraceae bacterium]|nr:glycosyltransferase family 2 protein [Lachnospiraceae bacterium]